MVALKSHVSCYYSLHVHSYISDGCQLLLTAGGPGPEIFIDFERFEPTSLHSLTVSVLTPEGQSATASVQFLAASAPDTASKTTAVHCSHARTVTTWFIYHVSSNAEPWCSLRRN